MSDQPARSALSPIAPLVTAVPVSPNSARMTSRPSVSASCAPLRSMSSVQPKPGIAPVPTRNVAATAPMCTVDSVMTSGAADAVWRTQT